MEKRAVVRLALHEDMAWVNARYAEINFRLSRFEKELIAIVEVNGKKAGLGRLVRVRGDAEELGGMYVLPEYRRQGLAESILKFLLSKRNPAVDLYCLPFESMVHFYEGFGFVPVSDPQMVPKEILEKHAWCNETYPHKTFLHIFNG